MCRNCLYRMVFMLIVAAIVFYALSRSGESRAQSVEQIAADRAAFVAHHQDRFPELALERFTLGVYAIDAGLYRQWQSINDFPPYEFLVEEGQSLYETAFTSGARYSDCFTDADQGVRQQYPYYDPDRKTVVTLIMAINDCRHQQGEQRYRLDEPDLLKLTAYMAFASREHTLNVSVPDDSGALAAYESGRQFFFSKRGRMNFACADCHYHYLGQRLRDQPLGPLLGAVNHYPVYGLSWGGLGSLHARFQGCMEITGAEALPRQSRAFRNLEFFLSVMSQGLQINGPGLHR